VSDLRLLVFQERSCGGVGASADRIVIGLAFGKTLKQMRHGIGDWHACASVAGTLRSGAQNRITC